jgi:2-phospho-L-lactate guanylyltransferase
MIVAVLPVKSPRNAKQRLSGYLTPGQRETLARTMFEEVLATLTRVRNIGRIIVASSDPDVLGHARNTGVDVLVEIEQKSHSLSADFAARHAAEAGARSVLLMPIDVPLVTPDEIGSLLMGTLHGLIVVPSSDGTGTNALVRTPPDAIRSCFGPGSFQAHCGQAETLGIPLQVMHPPGILFDIDTPEDVAELIARAPESRVGRLLRQQTGQA